MITLANRTMLVGLDAPTALQAVVEDIEAIASVTLAEYAPAPLVQDRADLTPDERVMVSKALELRGLHHLPFWDAVMLSAFNEPTAPRGLLDATLYHRTFRGSEIRVGRSDAIAGGIQRIVTAAAGRAWVAALSEVALVDGSCAHLPFLDLHCPKGGRTGLLARAMLDRIFGSGGYALLEGERSYHAWGLTLVRDDALVSLLARALLFSPIIDRAFVAHQLMERRCALRISAGWDKGTPRVVFVSADRAE